MALPKSKQDGLQGQHGTTAGWAGGVARSVKNLMHLGIDFWEDLGGFWEGK